MGTVYRTLTIPDYGAALFLNETGVSPVLPLLAVAFFLIFLSNGLLIGG